METFNLDTVYIGSEGNYYQRKLQEFKWYLLRSIGAAQRKQPFRKGKTQKDKKKKLSWKHRASPFYNIHSQQGE